MANANKSDKAATKQLVEWFRCHKWNRGCLPSVGISMFSVQGLGVPVRATPNGQVIAYFSSYEAASLAVSKADRV